jgi:membrane-associated phospholipid phosphatase
LRHGRWFRPQINDKFPNNEQICPLISCALKALFSKNLVFFAPYLLLLTASAWILLQEPKGWLVLYLNSHHQSFWDVFFRFVTKGGEEWAGIALGVFLLIFKPRRYFFSYLIAVVMMVLLVQLLKRGVFDDWYRPVVVLKDFELKLVEGVKMNKKYSFPSGHTSAGFLFFSFWAFISSNRIIKLFFLASAVLVGLSRIYLAQHFLQDVIAGSFLGVSLAMTACFTSRLLSSKSNWFNGKWRST